MKAYLSILALAVSVSSASAQNFDTTGGLAYKGDAVPVPRSVTEQIHAANDAARETYDLVRENGGCNADFIPYAIASGCFNIATGVDQDAPVGASKGGSD